MTNSQQYRVGEWLPWLDSAASLSTHVCSPVRLLSLRMPCFQAPCQASARHAPASMSHVSTPCRRRPPPPPPRPGSCHAMITQAPTTSACLRTAAAPCGRWTWTPTGTPTSPAPACTAGPPPHQRRPRPPAPRPARACTRRSCCRARWSTPRPQSTSSTWTRYQSRVRPSAPRPSGAELRSAASIARHPGALARRVCGHALFGVRSRRARPTPPPRQASRHPRTRRRAPSLSKPPPYYPLNLPPSTLCLKSVHLAPRRRRLQLSFINSTQPLPHSPLPPPKNIKTDNIHYVANNLLIQEDTSRHENNVM